MLYDPALLKSVYYSIVSPFDLSSSNEEIRNLTPASAGKLISDEVLVSNFDSCLVCFFNASSYNQLSVFLDEVYKVFSLDKIKNIKQACDYMESFEAKKRLSDSKVVSTVFRTAQINSLLKVSDKYNDLIALDDYENDLVVDADTELNQMKVFKADSENAMKSKNALVVNKLLVPSNKLTLIGSAQIMADAIVNHSESLPQNTPYTVGLCFSGTVEAVNYLDSMIVG